MITTLKTPPETAAVLVDAGVRLALKIDGTDQDDQISVLIDAAQSVAEHETGRRFVTQTVTVALEGWPLSAVELPLSPVQSIEAVRYLSASGAELQLPAESLFLMAGSDAAFLLVRGDRPALADVPGVRVFVDVVVGYGEASDLPASIRTWIIAHVGHMLRNPEATTDKGLQPNPFLAGLLDPHRSYR